MQSQSAQPSGMAQYFFRVAQSEGSIGRQPITASNAGTFAAVQSVETDESAQRQDAPPPANDELKNAFRDFVGQTFYGQMIRALRSTQQESKYFHGGQAERIFQAQFDQTLAEQLSETSAEQIADPMFDLFMLGRAR